VHQVRRRRDVGSAGRLRGPEPAGPGARSAETGAVREPRGQSTPARCGPQALPSTPAVRHIEGDACDGRLCYDGSPDARSAIDRTGALIRP